MRLREEALLCKKKAQCSSLFEFNGPSPIDGVNRGLFLSIGTNHSHLAHHRKARVSGVRQ